MSHKLVEISTPCLSNHVQNSRCQGSRDSCIIILVTDSRSQKVRHARAGFPKASVEICSLDVQAPFSWPLACHMPACHIYHKYQRRCIAVCSAEWCFFLMSVQNEAIHYKHRGWWLDEAAVQFRIAGRALVVDHSTTDSQLCAVRTAVWNRLILGVGVP